MGGIDIGRLSLEEKCFQIVSSVDTKEIQLSGHWKIGNPYQNIFKGLSGLHSLPLKEPVFV
jgi:hypothetical protein